MADLKRTLKDVASGGTKPDRIGLNTILRFIDEDRIVSRLFEGVALQLEEGDVITFEYHPASPHGPRSGNYHVTAKKRHCHIITDHDSELWYGYDLTLEG